MTDEEDKVVDLNMRRALARKARGEASDDLVIRAAERITMLYADLSNEVGTVDLFAAIALSERALMTMFRTSVGEAHARAMAAQGLSRAMKYKIHEPKHYAGPTVFDRDKETEDS